MRSVCISRAAGCARTFQIPNFACEFHSGVTGALRAFAATGLLVLFGLSALGQTPVITDPQETIPLNTPGIQFGTESVNTTNVANGNFEGGYASNDGGTHAFPVDWGPGRFGDTFAVAPVVGITADGTTAGRANINGANPINSAEGYTNSVALTLSPNTWYYLSAYMWNFSEPSAGLSLTTAVDLLPVGSKTGVSYVRMNVYSSQASTSTGYMCWDLFETGASSVSVDPRVFYDGGTGADTGWPLGAVGAQWDNVSVTPLSSFKTPNGFVPGPGSAAIFAPSFGCLVLLARRRRRP
jgi:hypothetical protein